MATTERALALGDELTRLGSWDEAKIGLARLRTVSVLDREEFSHLVWWVATYFLFAAEDLRSR